MIDRAFWKGRQVFLTGHTGFKGAWLVLLLRDLGSRVTGYSLDPPTVPSLFDLAHVKHACSSIHGDIRDAQKLKQAVVSASPEIIFHLAAQPLVRRSYEDPQETYSTNVMGTLNVLEAARACESVRAVVNVTTDKVYENREWPWGYREADVLGGHDPYASSKACSELLTASFRASFFPPGGYGVRHSVAIATARAGNVIGGGDWAKDRLLPDCVRAHLEKRILTVRNPGAVRPWQHVLGPLTGYITLAEALHRDGGKYSEAWNFGPDDEDARSVEWIIRKVADTFVDFPGYEIAGDAQATEKESLQLRLDCSKARQRLGWTPRWDVDKAISATWEWLNCFIRSPEKVEMVCASQISEYLNCL